MSASSGDYPQDLLCKFGRIAAFCYPERRRRSHAGRQNDHKKTTVRPTETTNTNMGKTTK